jgi:hypothetical protein
MFLRSPYFSAVFFRLIFGSLSAIVPSPIVGTFVIPRERDVAMVLRSARSRYQLPDQE